MKISSRFSVAVHILAILAIIDIKRTEDIKYDILVTSDQIAESVNTNPVVIRRILGKLKSAGMVDMKRGAGGTYLVKDIEDINLLEIYNAVENGPEESMFKLHENTDQSCPIGAHIQPCLKVVMDKAQKAMEDELEKVTMKYITDDIIKRYSGK